jgi:hypothetical protein
MELIGFLKSLAVMAFIATGGLAFLKWLVVMLLLCSALIVLRVRRRLAVVVVPLSSLLALGAFLLALVELPGRSDFYGDPNRYASMKLRDQAREMCEAELAGLPDVYPVSSVVDEVAALDEYSIVMLLTRRQLDFVEVKLYRAPGKPASIVRPHNHYEISWPVPAGSSDYVRIALAPEGAVGCLPQAALPEAARDYLKVWPLPVGMCVQTRFSAHSSARYALEYVFAPQADRPVWGHYRLRDTVSGRGIAQLTSADTPGQPSLGRISKLGSNFVRPDCFTPHTALADRLIAVGEDFAAGDGGY